MAVGFCDSLQLQIGFPCFIQPLRGEPKIRGSRCDWLGHPILPHLLINKSSRGTRGKGAQEQRQELPRVGEKPTNPLRYSLYFISVYVHEYAGRGTRVAVTGQLGRVYHVGSSNHTLVVRAGGRHLYLLQSHLTGPMIPF